MRELYEQVRPANTAEEMRAELFRLEHFDPLVRSVMDMANYKGLKGEDRYTILAYHAMQQLNQVKAETLETLMIRPYSFFVKTKDNDSGISLINKKNA